MSSSTQHEKIMRLVQMAILTALVIVLQFISSYIKLGPFSITLALTPVVIGAILYGAAGGAWLGFVLAVVVLLSGDCAAFLAISVFGTILTVLLKTTLAGLVAALIYKLIAKANTTVATVASALSCPIVNTGVFLLGCLAFFLPTLREWGEGAGFANVGAYMILGLVGANFLVELAVNAALASAVLVIIKAVKSSAR